MPEITRLRGLASADEDPLAPIATAEPPSFQPLPEDADFMRGLASSNYQQAAGDYYTQALRAQQSGDIDGAMSAQQQAEMFMGLAQENAPRLQSLRDVTGGSDLFDITQSALGSATSTAIPVLGAAVASRVAAPMVGGYLARGVGVPMSPAVREGITRVAPFAGAGTAAYPLELGEAVTSQFQDPVQMQASPDERMGVAQGKAIRNTMAEALIPGAIAATPFKRLMRNPAGVFTAETLGESGTEALQQISGQAAQRRLNPAVELGGQEVVDAAFQGLVGGAGMAAPGAALATGANALSEKFEKAKPKVQRAYNYGMDRLKDVGERLNQPSSNEELKGIAMGDADPSLQGANEEETAFKIEQRDRTNVEKVRGYAQEILNDPEIPDTIKNAVRSLGGDYRDAGAQTFVASALLAHRGGIEARRQVGAFIESSKEWAKRAKQKAVDKVVEAAGAAAPKKSLMEPKHQVKLQELVFKHLNESAKNDPKLRLKVPELANALADFLGNDKQLDADDLPTLLRLKDSMDVFDNPMELLEQAATTIDGIKFATTKKLFKGISSAEEDAKTADSFLYRSLTEEAKDAFSAPRLREIARDIDALSFVKSDKQFNEVVKQLAPIFDGGEKMARLVVDFYAQKNQAELGLQAQTKAEGVLEDEDVTDFEEQLPKKRMEEEYLFEDSKTMRPYPPGQRGENLIKKEFPQLGRETEGRVTDRIPYSQYLDETSTEPNKAYADAAERLLKSLDERLQDTRARIANPRGDDDVDMLTNNVMRLTAERGKLADAAKVGGQDLRQALSEYIVIRRRGATMGLSAEDARAFSELVRKKRDPAKPGAAEHNRKIDSTIFSFVGTTSKGRRRLRVSAESMWRHEAKLMQNDEIFKGLPREEQIRRAFLAAASRVLATKGVSDINIREDLILDRASGLKLGKLGGRGFKEGLKAAFDKKQEDPKVAKEKAKKESKEAAKRAKLENDIDKAYEDRENLEHKLNVLVRSFAKLGDTVPKDRALRGSVNVNQNEQKIWIEELEDYIKRKREALQDARTTQEEGSFIRNKVEERRIELLQDALNEMRAIARETEFAGRGVETEQMGNEQEEDAGEVTTQELKEGVGSTRATREGRAAVDKEISALQKRLRELRAQNNPRNAERIERIESDLRDLGAAPAGRPTAKLDPTNKSGLLKMGQEEVAGKDSKLVRELILDMSRLGTLSSTLELISLHTGIPQRYRELARALTDVARRSSGDVSTRVTAEIGENVASGEYREAERTVSINVIQALDSDSGTQLARIILHEAIHAFTVAALSDKESAVGQHMHKLYSYAMKNFPKGAWRTHYGATNAAEFVAEAFTNPVFQDLLRFTPPMTKKFGFKSLWHEFIDALTNFFGIKTENLNNSLLGEVLETGARIFARNDAARASPIRAMKSSAILGAETKEQFTSAMQAFVQSFAEAIRTVQLRADELALAQAETANHYEILRQRFAWQLAEPEIMGRIQMQMFMLKGPEFGMTPNEVMEDINDSILATLLGGALKFNTQLGEDASITPAQQKEILDEILRIRGKDLTVLFDTYANVGGSGSYDAQARTMKIAATALNPLSVAWHEAMHDFFALLGTEKASRKAKQDLLDAANSPLIKARLKRLLEGHPAAIEQLKDPEEALAYMYQFWAEGKLELGTGANTWFQRITEFIANLLGVMTSTGRVQALLTALHTGKFADQSVVGRELAKEMYDTASMRAERIAEPLVKGVNAVFTAATDRLRNLNTKATTEIADAFHREPGREEGGLGFLQRRSMANGQWLNALQKALTGLNKDNIAGVLRELQAMQSQSTEAQAIRRLLDQLHDYMAGAGVQRLNDEGEWEALPKVPDYFPRVWDAAKIRANEQAFIELVMKEGKRFSRPQAEELVKALSHGDGLTELAENEHHLGFTPYALSTNARRLTFITPQNAHLFIQYQKDDLVDIMSTYVFQAVHRAEYARQFGNDGEWIKQKLKEAQEQGATPEELATAGKAIQALEGTLGHSMNLQMRNVMAGLLTYENIVLLPLALFSSLIDPLGVALRSGDMGEAWRALKEGLKGLVGKNDETKLELAKTMGIIDQMNMLENMGNLYNGMYMSRRLRTWNQTFFRWNGMESWNRSMRISALGAGMRFIIKNQDNERYMKELGLVKSDVVALPDGTLDVSSAKVQAALFKFVDGAVLRPNAAHRPIWGSDPHFMLLFHLKQFTFSFANTILRRVKAESAEGVRMPAYILASYVPFMMASDLLRGGLTGATATWTMMDHLTAGISRSGILGINQFGVDAMGDLAKGQVPGASFIGPTAGHAVTVGKALADAPGVEFTDALVRSLPASAVFKALT